MDRIILFILSKLTKLFTYLHKELLLKHTKGKYQLHTVLYKPEDEDKLYSIVGQNIAWKNSNIVVRYIVDTDGTDEGLIKLTKDELDKDYIVDCVRTLNEQETTS